MLSALLESARRLTPGQIAGQVVFYLIFLGFVGHHADQPVYHHLSAGEAEIRLAVRHSGQLLGECRELSDSAVKQLAPNMRNPLVCPRERSNVNVELALNGEVLFTDAIAPAGLHNDGISAIYRSFRVREGPANLRVRIDDDEVHAGFTDEFDRELTLRSGDSLVVEYTDGFHLHGAVTDESPPRPRTGPRAPE